MSSIYCKFYCFKLLIVLWAIDVFPIFYYYFFLNSNTTSLRSFCLFVCFSRARSAHTCMEYNDRNINKFLCILGIPILESRCIWWCVFFICSFLYTRRAHTWGILITALKNFLSFVGLLLKQNNNGFSDFTVLDTNTAACNGVLQHFDKHLMFQIFSLNILNCGKWLF